MRLQTSKDTSRAEKELDDRVSSETLTRGTDLRTCSKGRKGPVQGKDQKGRRPTGRRGFGDGPCPGGVRGSQGKTLTRSRVHRPVCRPKRPKVYVKNPEGPEPHRRQRAAGTTSLQETYKRGRRERGPSPGLFNKRERILRESRRGPEGV